MRKISIAHAAFALSLLAAPAFAGDSPAPANAEAHFSNLTDGQTVKSPFLAKFEVSGLTVAPAGTNEPNTGHFHVLIDTTMTAEQMQYPITVDAQHVHFGKAQTETTLTLPPGKHTLQLLMGDGNHAVHNHPVMSKPITVTVE